MDELVTDNYAVNEVRLSLCDATRALHVELPLSMAEVVLAALTAEPETLAELETALARYLRPPAYRDFLRQFQAGLNLEAWDAGLIIIDLPARLIVAVTEPALYQPATRGHVLYCPDPEPDWNEVPDDEVCWVRYQLSADWLLVNTLNGWQALAAQRRAQRTAHPHFDTRPFLFGPALSEFIAVECLAARAAGIADPMADIHARWLLTPRAELRGQMPREIMHRRDFIDGELESRARQWSYTNECPLPIGRETAAYRTAGLGTHSVVVYFDLMRHLLEECWAHVGTAAAVKPADERARLEKLKLDWLEEGIEYSRSPQFILEQERLRIPLAITPHEAIIDYDCPVCLLALDPELGGPTFMHLDGHHLELYDSWVFSMCGTKAEWDDQMREWEEESRQMAERRAQREAEGKSFDRRGWTGNFDEKAENEKDGGLPF